MKKKKLRKKEEKFKRNQRASWRMEDIEKRKICQNKKIKRIKESGEWKNENKYLVLASLNNEIYQLTSLAVGIWLFCEKEKTKKEILEWVNKYYEKLNEDSIKKEVNEILYEMKKIGLLMSY